MKKFGVLALVMVVLFLDGCSDDKKKEVAPSGSIQFSGAEFIPVGESKLLVSPIDISGVGEIVALKPLAAMKSNQSYRVRFRLEEGGSLTVHSNATKELKQSAAIEFARAGKSLKVASLAGAQRQNISAHFESIDASAELLFQIDFHNGESPAHIIVWDGRNKEFTEENALFNSAVGGRSPGNGMGNYWGVSLQHAFLDDLGVGPQKVTEEEGGDHDHHGEDEDHDHE